MAKGVGAKSVPEVVTADNYAEEWRSGDFPGVRVAYEKENNISSPIAIVPTRPHFSDSEAKEIAKQIELRWNAHKGLVDALKVADAMAWKLANDNPNNKHIVKAFNLISKALKDAGGAE